MAQEAMLFQNVPNPFTDETKIRFSIPQRGRVQIDVYSASGSLIRSLFNETVAAGEHTVEWDGTDDVGSPVPTGVYVYQMQAPNSLLRKRMGISR